MLVRKELLSPEWAERILSWPHSGFNVHSLVRAKTKPEAERIGKYMIRPVLSLERLSLLEPEAKVGYRFGPDRAEQEAMDYLELRAGHGSLLRVLCQRPPGEDAEGEERGFPPDCRGRAPASPLPGLGGPNSEAS
jgi:hypothetical protein